MSQLEHLIVGVIFTEFSLVLATTIPIIRQKNTMKLKYIIMLLLRKYLIRGIISAPQEARTYKNLLGKN